MDDPFEKEYKHYLELVKQNPKFVPKCRPKHNVPEKVVEEVQVLDEREN